MAHEGLKVQLHAFTLTLDGGEWSAPRLSQELFPSERVNGIQRKREGLGGADPDYLEKAKFLLLP